MVLTFLVSGCRDLPRDPAHTLERIQKEHRIRVGVVESPPWIIRRPETEPHGAEPELVRRLASKLGATVDWHWGSETQHMNALRKFELDLVIAELDANSPWSKEVGMIRPYFEERIIVGVPPSASVPERLNGVPVAVRSGDSAAAELIHRHATPTRVAVVRGGSGAAAAPDGYLEMLGYRPTRFELEKREHVMAVPPGENGWIVRLEEFLAGERSNLRQILQSAAREELR